MRKRTGKLSDIVELYIANHRRNADREMEFFRIQKTLKDVIAKAGTARRPNGKCHDHQRRVGNRALRKFADRLAALEKPIKATENFEQLLAAIEEVGNDLPRIGELTTYDTAHRIGAYLGLEPTKVYLHRGTREGARKLKLGVGRKYLEMSDLPKEFLKLKPSEVEDCLCIYKSKLHPSLITLMPHQPSMQT